MHTQNVPVYHLKFELLFLPSSYRRITSHQRKQKTKSDYSRQMYYAPGNTWRSLSQYLDLPFLANQSNLQRRYCQCFSQLSWIQFFQFGFSKQLLTQLLVIHRSHRIPISFGHKRTWIRGYAITRQRCKLSAAAKPCQLCNVTKFEMLRLGSSWN